MIDFEKNILEVLEEGMTFRTFHPNRSEKLYKFLEFSGNDLVIENPDKEVVTISMEHFFLNNIKLEINFLDYTIVNSGNSDGWVITKDSSKPNYKGYECNLGNFKELEDAKEYCVRYFMIARPEVFATSICRKTTKQGSGSYHEWYLLKRCLENEGIEIPSEIGPSNDMNCMITFNGRGI